MSINTFPSQSNSEPACSNGKAVLKEQTQPTKLPDQGVKEIEMRLIPEHIIEQKLKAQEESRRRGEERAKEIERQFLEEYRAEKKRKEQALVPKDTQSNVVSVLPVSNALPVSKVSVEPKESKNIITSNVLPPPEIPVNQKSLVNKHVLPPSDNLNTSQNDAASNLEQTLSKPKKSPSRTARIVARISTVTALITSSVLSTLSCGPTQNDVRKKDDQIEILLKDKDTLQKENVDLRTKVSDLEAANKKLEQDVANRLKAIEENVKKCTQQVKASRIDTPQQKTPPLPAPKKDPPKDKQPKVIEKELPDCIKKKGEVPPFVTPYDRPDKSGYNIIDEPKIDSWAKIVRPVKSGLLKKDQLTLPPSDLVKQYFANAEALLQEVSSNPVPYYTSKQTWVNPNTPLLSKARQELTYKIREFINRWQQYKLAHDNSFTPQAMSTMSNELLALYDWAARIDQHELAKERNILMQETQYHAGKQMPFSSYNTLRSPIVRSDQSSGERKTSKAIDSAAVDSFLDEGARNEQIMKEHIKARARARLIQKR